MTSWASRAASDYARMADDVKRNEKSQREFVISTSRKPFLRAGWANLLIVAMVAFAFMSQKIAIHFEFGYTMSMMAAAIIGIIIFALYTRSLSRIVIGNSSMNFVCAIHRERYEMPNIKRIRVLGFTPSYWIIIAVFINKKAVPRIFHFSELHPSATEFRENVSKLKEFLRLTDTN